MTKTNDALKPCPFCGGDAEYEEAHFHHNVYSYKVQCSKCNAGQPAAPYDTKECSAKLWNTRSPAPQDSAALELVNDFQERLDKFGPNKSYILVTVSLSQENIDCLRKALAQTKAVDVEYLAARIENAAHAIDVMDVKQANRDLNAALKHLNSGGRDE